MAQNKVRERWGGKLNIYVVNFDHNLRAESDEECVYVAVCVAPVCVAVCVAPVCVAVCDAPVCVVECLCCGV